MHVSAKNLRPPHLDGSAENAFLSGACAALAIAIHDATGWPIVAVTDAHNVFDGIAGGGSAMHWMVRRPDGMLVDVMGAHEEDEVVERYDLEADDDKAAAGRSSREDAVEWYVECQGEPIPIGIAAKFVEAVIERAAQTTSAPSL